ncbi:S-adenosyl-L-methionine-dependent methyltransferase [Haematococcus lacustris]
MPGGKSTRCRGSSRSTSTEFAAYFSGIWGSRWPGLYAELKKAASHVALCNPHVAGSHSLPGGLLPVAGLPAAVQLYSRQDAATCPYDPPETDQCTGLKTYYWLDMASVMPPLLLDVVPGHAVLDMCAAPGGKTLVMAHCLFPPQLNTAHQQDQQHPELQPQPPPSQQEPSQQQEPKQQQQQQQESQQEPHPQQPELAGGLSQPPPLPLRSVLVANEPDPGRRARLARVLQEQLPCALLNHPSLQPGLPALHEGAATGPAGVRLLGQEGDKYFARGHEQEAYDRVLLDVPCSSERHVVQQALAAARGQVSASQWSVAGCRALAGLQLQLLLAGLQALRQGGRLVYSTCSLAAVENDEVVAKALARCPVGSLHIVLPGHPGYGLQSGALTGLFGAERTRYGVIVMPDAPQGSGPIYAAVLEKRGAIDKAALGVQLMRLPDNISSDGSDDELEQAPG